MSKHTPGPWRIDNSNNYDIESYNEETGTTFGICQMYADESMEANARHIVHCVNCHDELLEALQAVYSDIELQNVKGGSDELNFIVQQALAKAESEG